MAPIRNVDRNSCSCQRNDLRVDPLNQKRAVTPPNRTSLRRLAILFLLVLLSVIGCSAGDGDDDDDGDDGAVNDGSLSTLTRSATTGSDGSAQISFEVPSGTNKFHVSAEASGNAIRFDTIADDANTNFLTPGGEFISFASEFLAFVNNATVPSRDFDPSIDTSRTFRARATAGRGSFNSPVEGVDMNFRIDSRGDTNLDGGSLRVNLFFVGSIGQSGATRSAISVALEEFRRIYRESAGISLTVSDSSIAGSDNLPSPFNGSSFYQSASSTAASPAVNVFVAGDVDSGFGSEVLGISGGIPGPPHPSPRSAVVVSIIQGAGPDGSFDDEELRVLGETMAHESGHFMGLFHPVDFGGSSVSGTDPLPDTATCTNFDDCTGSRKNLVNNLMFPFPVEGDDGSLIAQNGISAQQRGVLNRYIAVD